MAKQDKKVSSKERQEPTTKLLRERAMLVLLAVSRWYGTGADEAVVSDLKTKHNASGDIGTFTKRFMSRDKLQAINQVTNDARRYHKSMTLPWGDQGSRMLSADLFFEYKQKMTSYEMQFGAAVEEFLGRYPSFIAEERKRLSGLFKQQDYPTSEEMRRRFVFRLNIEPLPSAEDFRVDLGEEELQRIRGDIEKRLDESVKHASIELWERMQVMVEKIKERLEDKDSGVRKALFENLRELVAVLPKFNITGDPDLKAIAQQVTNDLLDVKVAEVSEDEALRKEVSKKADKILDVMKSYVKKGGAA